MRNEVLCAMAIAGCCHAASAAASAVQTTYLEIDEGNAVSLLEETSQYYVHAMRNLVMDRYPEDYRAIRWETLETSMTGKSVARFEYRYVRNGMEAIRVYQSIDGLPLTAVAEEIFGAPSRPQTPGSPASPQPPSTPETPSPEPGAEAPGVTDQAVADLSEDHYFAALDDSTVRARIIPDTGSKLHSFEIDGADRGLDAEFKIMRTIENDIANNVVPRGGQLQGFVSETVCLSCRHALTRLADVYAIDIRITQLRPNFSALRERELLQSGTGRWKGKRLVSTADGSSLLAHDQLFEARTIQARQQLTPRLMNRGFKGRLWRQRSIRLRVPRVSDVAEEPGNAAGNADAEAGAMPGMEPPC